MGGGAVAEVPWCRSLWTTCRCDGEQLHGHRWLQSFTLYLTEVAEERIGVPTIGSLRGGQMKRGLLPKILFPAEPYRAFYSHASVTPAWRGETQGPQSPTCKPRSLLADSRGWVHETQFGVTPNLVVKDDHVGFVFVRPVPVPSNSGHG